MPTPDRARRHTAAAVLRRIDDETVSRLEIGRERYALKVPRGDFAAMPEQPPRRAHAAGQRVVARDDGRAARREGQQGVRTQREIERERYALKALRGDFDEVPSPNAAPEGEQVRAVLRAVDR